jgi:hypothetical protein
MNRKMSVGTYILFVMFMGFISIALSASWGGYVLKTRKTSSSGCGCHGAADTTVSVKIIGPDTMAAGTTANFQVVITGGPMLGGGTDIAVMDGTLIEGPGLYSDMNELTHSQPMAPANSKVTFSFQFTAPADAEVDTMYANGNSINNDGDATGDSWNFAPNKAIVITPAAQGVKDNAADTKSFRLEQNFPNPFNPSTNISFSLPKSETVTLDVVSSTGEYLQTIASGFFSEGRHEVFFSSNLLPSGIYLYQIKTGASSITKKMLLLK